MDVRAYRAADYNAVWELHVLALKEAGAYGGEGPWEYDLHHIEEVYSGYGGAFLVDEEDGRIVAMGALKRLTTERAEIKRMRVHPAYQRRGFGEQILRELEARARELKYTALVLDTATVQVAAQGLYRKCGFKETGEIRVNSSGFTDLYFEKPIL